MSQCRKHMKSGHVLGDKQQEQVQIVYVDEEQFESVAGKFAMLVFCLMFNLSCLHCSPVEARGGQFILVEAGSNEAEQAVSNDVIIQEEEERLQQQSTTTCDDG